MRCRQFIRTASLGTAAFLFAVRQAIKARVDQTPPDGGVSGCNYDDTLTAERR